MAVEVRSDLAGINTYSVTYDLASIATVSASDAAVTVPGVLSTDTCLAVIPPAALNYGLVVQSARVTANDTITVRIMNITGGGVDAASGTWKFAVGR